MYIQYFILFITSDDDDNNMMMIYFPPVLLCHNKKYNNIENDFVFPLLRLCCFNELLQTEMIDYWEEASRKEKIIILLQ